jgi:2'-5' RNA ligase
MGVFGAVIEVAMLPMLHPGKELRRSMMGRDASGLDREVTGVFELAWVDTSAQYESALVYPMPPVLVEMVGVLRRHLGMGAPPEFQLEPHLTVLSLGHLDGAKLLTLWRCLHDYRQETVEVGLQEFGTFGAGGRITNIHIRIAPSPALLALHSRVLRACTRFPWFVPGPYVGPSYTPHVSILDHLAVRPDDFQLPRPTWTVGQQLRLDHLHMNAKQIECSGGGRPGFGGAGLMPWSSSSPRR